MIPVLRVQTFANKVSLPLQPPTATPRTPMFIAQGPTPPCSPMHSEYYDAPEEQDAWQPPASPAETYHTAWDQEGDDATLLERPVQAMTVAVGVLALRSTEEPPSLAAEGRQGPAKTAGCAAEEDRRLAYCEIRATREKLSGMLPFLADLDTALEALGDLVQASDFTSEYEKPRPREALKDLEHLLDVHHAVLVESDMVATLHCVLNAVDALSSGQDADADAAPTAVGTPEIKPAKEFVDDREVESWVHVEESACLSQAVCVFGSAEN